MKTAIRLLAILVAGAALLAAIHYWQMQHAQAPAPETVAPPPVASAPAPQPAPALELNTPPPIQHPIATEPPAQPLPSIDNSDAPMADAVSGLVGKDRWHALFVPDQIVRHIVATVDNLPRSEAPTTTWPVQPAPSWMKTEGSGDQMHIAPANAARYAPYVALVQAIDVDKLVDVYRRFYPLFQQAYVNLGYPGAYFNDRLVVAIDNLLAAPEPAQPPLLVQKKVLYQYADPDLESRSAGQKIMIRIGVQNERIVKAKLRQLRAAITRQPPAGHAQ